MCRPCLSIAFFKAQIHAYVRINILLYVYETVPVRVLDPRFQIRREIGDLFITNIYISHYKIVYNHVSDVDIVSDLQNTQLYTHLK